MIVAAAVVLVLAILGFVVKPYRVPSGSMLPTIHPQQRVLVDRIGIHFAAPHVGEVFVFHAPRGADVEPAVCGAPNEGVENSEQACDEPTKGISSQTFIKRVVAGPGDRISIVGGHVIRNGVREKDSYIAPCGGVAGCTFREPIVIPCDHYFMMGDDRGDSDDSRFWGPIPKSWIIGKAFFTYYPPDRIGFL